MNKRPMLRSSIRCGLRRARHMITRNKFTTAGRGISWKVHPMHGANLLETNKTEGVVSHVPPIHRARASMSTIAGIEPTGRLPGDAPEQGALSGQLRCELLKAVDMPGSADPDSIEEVLHHVNQVLGSPEPEDKERALAFLQVMANHGLFPVNKGISMGTSVHLGLARLAVDRAHALMSSDAQVRDTDGGSVFVDAAKSSGKSAMLQAMCKVISVLAPGSYPVYIDALYVCHNAPTQLRLRSLGNAVWHAVRAKLREDLGDEGASEMAKTDSKYEGGEVLALQYDVMPLVRRAGMRLLLLVDSIDHYFTSTNPSLGWGQDLTFVCNERGAAPTSIVAGASSNLRDILAGAAFMEDRFSRATQFEGSRRRAKHYSLPLTDQFDLEVARRALRQPVDGVDEIGMYHRALVMIMGGSVARRVLSGIVPELKNSHRTWQYTPWTDMLKPFDDWHHVQAVYPPGNAGLEAVAEHIYYGIYRRNQNLWEQSGVAGVLHPGDRKTWDTVGAMDALAKYIARTGEGWDKGAELWVPETELYGAYEEMQLRGNTEGVDSSAARGVELLVQYRFLVPDGNGRVAAPSLAHLVARSRPSPYLTEEPAIRGT